MADATRTNDALWGDGGLFDQIAAVVAEAKAEALREAAAMFDDDSLPYSATDVRYVLLARADELTP